MKRTIDAARLSACRDQFIRALLDGKRETTPAEVFVRRANLGLDWLEPPFAVACVSPDYTSVPYERKDEIMADYRQYLSSLLQRAGRAAYCLVNGYNNIQVLLSLARAPRGEERLDELFIGIHERLLAHFGLELFIGIGGVVERLEEVSSSALTAHEMLGYKFQYADRGVIDSANIVQFRHPAFSSANVAYERVIGCFQDGNLGKMSVRLDELAEQVLRAPNADRAGLQRALIELTVNVLSLAAGADVDVDAVLGGIDPYRWILRQENAEALKEWFMRLATALVGQMNQKKGSEVQAKVLLACRYIEENLPRASLSLQEISESVALSRTYLSQLFKKEQGIGVNAYIAEQRLQRAMRLLAETSLQNREIAAQTGFASVSYFSQVFKKRTGLTPGQYRAQHRQL